MSLLGFTAARWRRAVTLDHLDVWGLGGQCSPRRLGAAIRPDLAVGRRPFAGSRCSYVGFVALLLNLLVSVVATGLCAGKVPEAEDATGPADYAPTGTRHGAVW